MNDTSPLPPLNRQFVAHFGEMGSRWGINRTVGQIYALIFLSPRAINADEIAESLAFSRSNVSMGLKELPMLRGALLEEAASEEEQYAQQRIREMHDLINQLMTWFDDVQGLSPQTAKQLMAMGATVSKVLGLKDRLTGGGSKRPPADPCIKEQK